MAFSSSSPWCGVESGMCCESEERGDDTSPPRELKTPGRGVRRSMDTHSDDRKRRRRRRSGGEGSELKEGADETLEARLSRVARDVADLKRLLRRHHWLDLRKKPSLGDPDGAPPARPAIEAEEEPQKKLLEWRADYREWLRLPQDPGAITVEDIEKDFLQGVVDAIDEPSLYLLAATPDTFAWFAVGEGRCCAGWRLMSTRTLIITFLVALLTFLTFFLPLAMLANFYKRNLDWSDFSVDVDETNAFKRTRHRVYLQWVSAALLSYVLYSSLSVLQQIKVFRFFLLGDLPGQLAAKREKQQQQPQPPEKEQQNQTISMLVSRTKVVLRDLVLGTDKKLARPFLVLGVVSKISSLLCLFQLTYLIFRTGFTAVEMILNSVALQFLLDVDRILTASLKNTIVMRRYYANAIAYLRAEAELVVATPDLVRSMTEPVLFNFPELVRNALTNQVAERLIARYPRTFSWLRTHARYVPNPDAHLFDRHGDPVEPAEWQRVQQFRRCCRSELGHRMLSRFIFVYGGLIVLLQIGGNLICSHSFICRPFENRGGGGGGDNVVVENEPTIAPVMMSPNNTPTAPVVDTLT